MNILFITSTYLGDTVLSTGILDHLYKKHPQAYFRIACGPVPAPLFQVFPGSKTIHIINKRKFSLHWVLLWIRCLFKKWDLIIDIRGTGISYFLWASKRQVWYSSSEKILRVHQLARWMGLKETPFNKIWLTDRHHQEAKQLLPVGSTYIAFAPTANWDKKCWPLEHFVDLGKKLLQDKKTFPNGKIIILGTSDQRPNLNYLFKEFKSEEIIDLMGQVSLPTLSACLSRCALFVGNDSGLMHLAAASDIPTIGLFGPSPVDVYGPWGYKTAYVRLNEDQFHILGRTEKGEDVMKDITVDSVHKKINELLKNS